MPAYENCLLTDKFIQVRTIDGKDHEYCLPEVLVALTRNEVEAFSTLQRYQQHPWHAFLVQLAVMTLQRHCLSSCEQVEDWREMLLNMSGGMAEAWSLVVESLDKPAFLQPPLAEGNLKEFNSEGVSSPDQIDLLITSKNHDLKMERIIAPKLSHWLYSLISLQTMQGFLGNGNYGIARMNGGFGNRPCVTFRSGFSPGRVFNEDVEKCLAARSSILEDYEHYKDKNGLCLLWLEPWDGIKQLELNQLDPFFIEICRRVRMTRVSGGLKAFLRPTKAARIMAKDFNGRTGDPWTPVNKEELKALCVAHKGFDYELTQKIIFEDGFKKGATQALCHDGSEAYFWGSALVRGKGITEGYFERQVRIPAKVKKMLIAGSARDNLGERSKRWVNSAAIVRKNVLWPALARLSSEKAPQFAAVYNDKVDQRYFHQLWADADKGNEEADKNWEIGLLDLATAILRSAIDRIPAASASFYRISCEAEGLLNSCKKKHFPHLYAKEEIDGTK